MKFVIDVDMTNAAFATTDKATAELERILAAIVKDLHAGNLSNPIFIITGETVGHWELTESQGQNRFGFFTPPDCWP